MNLKNINSVWFDMIKLRWILLIWIFYSYPSWSLPTFSQQAQMACSACHLNFGELTPVGRKFKLMGYARGNRVNPLSVNGTVSLTKISNTDSSIDPSVSLPKNGKVLPEELNVFMAGKLTEQIGGNVKITVNAIKDSCQNAYASYQKMLDAGVAREVARIVLPVTIYSSVLSLPKASSTTFNRVLTLDRKSTRLNSTH